MHDMTYIIKKQRKACVLKKRALTFFSLVCTQNCYMLRVIFLSMVSVASVSAQTTSTQIASTQAASTQITQTQTVSPQSVYNVTTFAGDGSNSAFSIPNAVVVDKNGNVYVTNPGNNKIIKITSAGIVTTLAGSGTVGAVDGNGSSSQFYAPTGITIDSVGNLFVADKLNNRIRKITPNGDVTTFAGSSAGFADGVGTAAQFNGPYNVAIDSSDNLYVTDTNNNRIRKITSTGVVTTVAGSGVAGAANGIGTAAQFNLPFGITVDSSGNLYISDTWNHLIRKITPNGTVTTFAGSVAGFADGTGTSAMFNAPGGITVDALGNVYVADISNQRIRKITSSGVVTTIAGAGTIGFADNTSALQALFNQPFGISTDSAGNLYVADTSNSRIRKLTPSINSPIAVTQSAGILAAGTTQSAGTLVAGTQAVNTASVSTQPASTLAAGTTQSTGTLAVGTQSVNTASVSTQPAGTLAAGTTQSTGTLAVGTQSVNTASVSTQPASTLAVGTTQATGTLVAGTQAVNTASVSTQPDGILAVLARHKQREL
jgi:sugar lactone lactonase YvrE